jgi:hypothetical protein
VREAEELATKIRAGRERLLLLPAKLAEELAPIVEEWETERDKLLTEAATLEEAEAKAADERARVDEAMEAFHQLGEWLAKDGGISADMKTQALATLVDRIELRFETWDRGPKWRQSRCVEFMVYFREVSGLLSRLTVDVLPRIPAAGR